MKKIIFNNIDIKNFLSVGDDNLILNFNQGLNLITGINKDKDSKNGCGKTTLLEALYWCLFGNTIRDLKKDKIIHNLSKKDCKVVLNFSKTSRDIIDIYRIERGIEPTFVHLYKNEENITLSSMPKTDECIKEIIGGGEELFKNAVIMSLDNTLPFMAQKKVEKRKFVEGILQIDIFSQMLSKIRQDYNDTKKEYEVFVAKFEEQQKNLCSINEQIKKNKDQKKLKIQNIEDKINFNLKKIKEINELENVSNSIDKCKENISTVETVILAKEKNILKITDAVEVLNKEEAITDNEISQTKNEIKKIKTKSGTCPTCKRKYNDEDEHLLKTHLIELEKKQTEIEKKYRDISEKLKEQLANRNKESNTIKEYKEICKKLNEKIIKLSSAAQEIVFLETINNDLKLESYSIELEEDSLLDIQKKLLADIKNSEISLEELQKKLNILEASKFVVSEEGVKGFIIKKMITVLNQKLNYYLKILEAPCTCNFDEYFEETLINDRKKECSYFNFSGGERKRIDLAILFTFQEVLKTLSGVNYTLNFYDELLDSALDQRGVKSVLDILKTKAEEQEGYIYIISHNSNINQNDLSQIIFLEKNNGKTQLVF